MHSPGGMFSVYFVKLAKVRYICILFQKINESPNHRIAGRLRTRREGEDMGIAPAITLAPDMLQGPRTVKDSFQERLRSKDPLRVLLLQDPSQVTSARKPALISPAASSKSLLWTLLDLQSLPPSFPLSFPPSNKNVLCAFCSAKYYRGN